MCLRQLLDFCRSAGQGIVKELHHTVLEHVQDDLGVLRVVLVPAILRGLDMRAGAGRTFNQGRIDDRRPGLFKL